MEAHIWAPLGVETHKFPQSGGFDDIKARLSPEGAGLPVDGGADGVSQQAFQGEGSPHLHDTLSKYAVRACFLQHKARIKL